MRGPLAALEGTPGLRAALVRAGLVALVRTGGLVALAVGLSGAVAAVVDGGAVTGWALLALAGTAVRAGAGGLGDVLAARDARRGEDALRSRVLTRLLAGRGEAVDAAGGTGPAAVLAGTRLHELGPALATVVPALADAAVVPLVVLVALGATDPLSAVLVGVTLPLVPLFLALVGMHTRDSTAAAAAALDRVAEHVAELVRGLPVLVGLGRAADQLATLARLGRAHRERTLATLRVAFLSALVLEVLATLSVALVAVTVGVRLVGGSLGLQVGLLALLLAPEAFGPLRALGAAHHASEDAAEAVRASRELLALPVAVPAVTAGAGLEVRDLVVRFDGRDHPAVDGVSLAVAPGEVLALRGPSGCGKSTVLGVLAGAVAPTSGTVALPGPVALVPQHPRTTGTTVADELAVHGGGPAELARVGAGHLADRLCRTLSPGELARVAFARALARVRHGARVVLLDEPTASLDDDATALVAGVLAELRGVDGVRVVLVSHEPALTALADRTLDLAPGVSPTSRGQQAPLDRAAPTCRDLPSRAGRTIRSPEGLPDTAKCAGRGQGRGHDVDGLGWPRAALARSVTAGTASAASAVALTAISGWLVVRAAEQPPMLTLLVAIVGVRATGLLRAGLRWLERLATHDAALSLATRTRTRVWSALTAQGPAADRTPGRALARVVGDVGLLQDLSVRVLAPPWVSGAVLAGTAAALAVLDLQVGLVTAGVLAVAVAVIAAVHRAADRGPAREADELTTRTLHETATVLDGAADLRAHGLADAAVARLDALGRRQGSAARRASRATAATTAVSVLACGAAAVCATALHAPTLAPPVVAVLALAPLALLEPLTALGAALRQRRAWADARTRTADVLAAPVPAEPGNPVALPRPVRRLDVTGLRAGWPDGPDVLTGVDAHAAPGSWLVVTGPSGSGKSTLLAVLLGALRPRAGTVSLGGVDTATTTTDELRAVTAWCPQDAHVFAAGVRANLALADPGADEAAMRAVLHRVGLRPLLAGLPDGLDTGVGSGGAALSGGERRRLAVARALLADRDVVLLDEPTAHLDPPTAAALVADLRRGLADRVVVCVTHDAELARPGDTLLDLGRHARVAA
ncbi:thiol reductant ABC exporter subunit CydD [Rhodococcus aerolatus]